jgi:sialidase-1
MVQAAARVEQVDLFRQGEAGVHTYRIPALAETRKGVLIALADARHDSENDLPGRLSLVMRRSLDGGRTWTPSQTIVAPKEGGAGDASLLLDAKSNRVWCFYAYGPPGIGFPTAQPGERTGAKTLQIHAIHSDDDGASWSNPAVDLTPQIKDPSWQAVFVTSGTHFMTSRGRMILPLVVRAQRQGPITARNAYSDDRGKTWKVGPAIGDGTDESKVTEVSDGTILQNMRSTGGFRLVARSRDGSVTFDAPVADRTLIDPGCNAGIAVVRKGVLAFTNAASKSKRENLTIRLSDDGGSSWTAAKVLHAGPAAYSTVVPLQYGKRKGVAVLYERGDRHAVERITFAVVDESWIRQPG